MNSNFGPASLYGEAASEKSDRSLFASALEQLNNGKPDHRTLEPLQSK
jgi:hypothetical protein